MREIIIFSMFLLAPVPKEPPITESDFYGCWKYDWGHLKDGWIEFRDDGTYIFNHMGLFDSVGQGKWYFDKETNSVVSYENLTHVVPAGCWKYQTKYKRSIEGFKGNYNGIAVILRRD